MSEKLHGLLKAKLLVFLANIEDSRLRAGVRAGGIEEYYRLGLGLAKYYRTNIDKLQPQARSAGYLSTKV